MKKILFALYLAATFFLISCEPKEDRTSLGVKLKLSDLKFDAHIATEIDGNTILLKNNTPGTIPLFDYGTGKSTKQIDTVHFAFKGTYKIYFYVLSAGGYVGPDSVSLTVLQDNFNYINDPLWTAISGGVGKAKTWLLDLDANGVSKYFAGPLYFYGTNNGWGGECFGTDCWNWNPDWAGNTWLMPKGDYGTMTFSLKDGPYVTVNHTAIAARGTENGTYFLDANAKTLTMVSAAPLHDAGRETAVSNWGSIKLLSLTENTMQLAVLRTNSEGPCLLVYNYISKEYSDNYVPPVVVPSADVDIEFKVTKDEFLTALAGGANTSKTWVMDTIWPVDWTKKSGYGGWTTDQSSSREWGWNDGCLADVRGATITFEKAKDGTLKFTRNQFGSTTTGTFSVVDTSRMITITGNQILKFSSSWMPTAPIAPETSYKLVKGNPATIDTKGFWIGVLTKPDEYLVYHYKLKTKIINYKAPVNP